MKKLTYRALRPWRLQIGGVLLIVLALLWFCLGHGVMLGENENQNDIRRELGIWTSETLFEQTFVASHNHLTRIDFFVDSYYPWESPYLVCRLYELETIANPAELTYADLVQTKKLARERRLNGWLISGHMPNSCSFAPLPASQGKRYLFSLQSPALKGGGGSILLASPVDRIEQGSFFLNGKPEPGDLSIRILYRQPRLAILRQSVRRVALQKPFPFSHPTAYYILGVGYLALLGALWRVSTRKP